MLILALHILKINKLSRHRRFSFYRDGKVSLVFIRSLLTFENPPLGIAPHYSSRQWMSDVNRFSSVANKRPAGCLQTPCWESDWSVPVTGSRCAQSRQGEAETTG